MVRDPKSDDGEDVDKAEHADLVRQRDEVLEAIGSRIKAARLRADLTQAELASRVGCTKGWIYLAEDGQGNAKIHSLYRVADALGVPIHSLLPPSAAEPCAATSSDIEGLSDAALAELDAAVETLLNTTIRDMNRVSGKLHKIKALSTGT